MFLRRPTAALFFALLLAPAAIAQPAARPVQQKIPDGTLEGVVSPDNKVRTFKNIPYAAPPVGTLRWKPPQPVIPWEGVRPATDYPPRAMQGKIYDDMIFNDKGPSEDCLYLNLWMPEGAPPKLPVMVWIHGGGFIAGGSSEPRQDAGNLSKKGVLVVTMNYRLGIFGFFAHPELTKESPNSASGNYGLLDQVAALQWVQKNIAAFGGDPDNVTLFGESAGSSSVSALIASPLARGLFQRAIGESGAFFDAAKPMKTRAAAEEADVKFAQDSLGTPSLAALRAKPAQEILDAALKLPHNAFVPIVDGYLLPADCTSIYAAGKQAHIPLLAGWNQDEGSYKTFLGNLPPTPENFAARAKTLLGDNAADFLKVYTATTNAEVKRAAQDYDGDLVRVHSIWKWLDLHLQTGGSPVYRFEFEQTLPPAPNANPNADATAPHASEIEFVFRVLQSRKLPWRQEDRNVSELMASYWTNFAKTGNPNSADLPMWPKYNSQNGYQVMHLKAESSAAVDDHRDRYEFLEHLNTSPAK